MRQKGFMLLEAMISVSFIGVILFVLFNVFVNELVTYKTEKENVKKNISMEESLNFIENKIDNTKNIEVISNELIITDYPINNDKTTNTRKIIKLNNNSLIIRYEYKDNYVNKWWHKSTNVIIKPIKQFILQREGSVIYITIVDDKGRKCRRSLYIRN